MTDCFHTNLRPRGPEPDDGIDSASRQHAGDRVGLEAVDDGVVATQDSHDVRRHAIPDEERSVVGAGDDVLAVAGASNNIKNVKLF